MPADSSLYNLPADALAEFSDTELLEKAKENPEFFGGLMQRYEAPLTRYLMRLTGWAAEEVQDILQEAFIKTYQHLNDYDTSLKFSTWMYRITHNQAIDVLRKQKSRPPLSALPIEDAAQFVAAKENAESQLLHTEDIERIREAIARLPLKYREPLILRFLEERSYDEIMDILKKPKGTVASLIKRGKEMLLQNLEEKESSL